MADLTNATTAPLQLVVPLSFNFFFALPLRISFTVVTVNCSQNLGFNFVLNLAKWSQLKFLQKSSDFFSFGLQETPKSLY